MPALVVWSVAVAVAVLGFAIPPVVVGTSVVRPAVLHVVAVVGLRLLSTSVAARTGRANPAAGGAAAVVCVALVSIHVLWSWATTSYTILSPTGPDGCRVVARESAVLMSGDGSLGVVGPFGGPVRMRGDYAVDDGGTPMTDGTYRLRWGSDESAFVTIPDAYDNDPVEPDLAC